MLKRMTVHFSGMVQGVGFRYTALHVSRRFPAISGFVRNLYDGRVELVVEGEGEDVRAFVREVRESMSEYIRSAVVREEPATAEFAGFEIRH